MPDANFADNPGPTISVPAAVQVEHSSEGPWTQTLAPALLLRLDAGVLCVEASWPACGASPRQLWQAGTVRYPMGTPCPISAGYQEFPYFQTFAVVTEAKVPVSPLQVRWRPGPQTVRERLGASLVAFRRFSLHSEYKGSTE